MHVLLHLFPFATINDHKVYQTLSKSNNSYSTNTCSTLKPPKIKVTSSLSSIMFLLSKIKILKMSLTVGIITLKKFKVLII